LTRSEMSTNVDFIDIKNKANNELLLQKLKYSIIFIRCAIRAFVQTQIAQTLLGAEHFVNEK